MQPKMERTKFVGVYFRQSANKRNHRDGKIDICFYFSCKIDNKKSWVKVGWKSEGYTAVFANDARIKHMQTAKLGDTICNISNKKIKNKLTVDEAWKIYEEKWLPTLAKGHVEEGRYRIHIAPRLGTMPLNTIKPLDLENIKQDLLKSGLAPATTRHILGIVRRLFNKLIEWELYDESTPFTKFKMPKVDNARLRFLTPDEADTLLSTIKKRSQEWWQISLISLHTGLRLGEIINLSKNDIDLETGTIFVRDGKTGSRIAHMTTTIKSIFENIIKMSPSPFLFPAKGESNSSKMSTSASSFKRAVIEAGFNKGVDDTRQKVVFHTLRHTFASWLVMRGVPLYNVGQLIGHSSVEMTKRYAHLSPNTQREAIKEIDMMINQSCNNHLTNLQLS